MNFSEEHYLQQLGLKGITRQHWLANDMSDTPWRVTAVDRGLCSLVSIGKNTSPRLPPSGVAGMLAAAETTTWPEPFVQCRASPPLGTSVAVGDWVQIERADSEAPRITTVLDRGSWLRRNIVGGTSAEQLIATNIDLVLIVNSFAPSDKLETRSLKVRRIERYVAAVREGNAEPVVVLNKVDLAEGEVAKSDLLSARLSGSPVVCVSALMGHGVAKLCSLFSPGQSVALVGMSGVGKSSLVNCLLGSSVLETGAARSADVRGKHTTTRRQMLRSNSGVLLIDTPGMRELGVLSSEGSTRGFGDIERLAMACRFADCGHDNEPGCAVRKAMAAGELPSDRLDNYRGIERETLRNKARHSAHARHLQRKEGKRMNKRYKEAVDSKKH